MVATRGIVTEPLRERAAAMVERVTLECNAVRVRGDVALVRAAVTAALAVRNRVIEHDHDPRYLHPARTVLILISDGACRAADVLAASAFVESLPDDPRADPACLTPSARALLAEVPLPEPDADLLLERLVTGRQDAALIALAERLDHARHLHLMTDIAPEPFLATIASVYVPVARRIAPAIAARLERWSAAFARRRYRAGAHYTPLEDAAGNRP